MVGIEQLAIIISECFMWFHQSIDMTHKSRLCVFRVLVLPIRMLPVDL